MSIFLGTGDSKGYPCPNCRCVACEEARRLGGKAIKTRSDFLIDEHSVIDFGPDILCQMLTANVMMDSIKNVFMTHSHFDHISISSLLLLNEGTGARTTPINFFGPKGALEFVEDMARRNTYRSGTRKGLYSYTHLKYCPLEYFETVETDGIRVTTLKSSHEGWGENELGFNYVVEKDGKTLLYATDTGWYPDETWEFLKNSDFKFDYVIMENTYGKDPRNIIKLYAGGHLNTTNFFMMLDKLVECGCMTVDTPVYATHIADAGREPYGDLLDAMENNGKYTNVQVAYDGQKLDF